MEGLGSLLDSLLARQVGMSIHEDPFKNSMDPYGILNTPQARQVYGPPVPTEQKQIDPSLLSGGFGEDIGMVGFEGRAPLGEFNTQQLIDPRYTQLKFGLKPTNNYEQYAREGDIPGMFNNMKFNPKDVYFNYTRDNANAGYGGPKTIQNFQLGNKGIGADFKYEFEPGYGISSLFK